MRFLSTLILRLAGLGPLGVMLFICAYVVATVTLAPPFLLTVAAGAIYGVWKGSLIVMVGASLGASAAYAVAVRLSGTRLVAWLNRHPRVAAARAAVRHEGGAWVQFLLRLSPVVPFSLLNYTLGLAHVKYRDFAIALVGMIPTVVLYAYYGWVVGDVTLLASGVAPPRGPGYYALVAIGLVATVIASHAITRAARRAIEQQRLRRGSTSSDPQLP